MRGLFKFLALLAIEVVVLSHVQLTWADRRDQPSLSCRVVREWRQAGATLGWIGTQNEPLAFRSNAAETRTDVPGFRFDRWKTELVKGIPSPRQPFGLDLSNVSLADREVGQLARFKYLQVLYLDATDLTPGGIGPLAGLDLQILTLISDELREAAATHLAGFKKLRKLHFLGEKISSRSLKRIGRIGQLESLTLMCTVPNEALHYLTESKKLRHLALPTAGVNDTGLKNLVRLEKLQTLQLYSNKVTDRGMKYVGKLIRLRTLVLKQNSIGNTGVGCLKNLKQLRVLDLSWTKVADKGISHVANLKNLSHLNVSNTKVTDAAIKDLVKLQSLTHIDLSGTGVTVAGVAELVKAIPGVKIMYTQYAIPGKTS